MIGELVGVAGAAAEARHEGVVLRSHPMNAVQDGRDEIRIGRARRRIMEQAGRVAVFAALPECPVARSAIALEQHGAACRCVLGC